MKNRNYPLVEADVKFDYLSKRTVNLYRYFSCHSYEILKTTIICCFFFLVFLYKKLSNRICNSSH